MGIFTNKDKIVSLKEAAEMVADGDVVAVGGALSAREPIALIHELIRQGKKRLATIGGAHGLDVDLMCAGGIIESVQNSYVGFEFDFGLAPNYRRACQDGRISVKETDCNFSLRQLWAAHLGVPFLPMPRVGGTDLLTLHPEFTTIACPYTGEILTAVPALSPDVAILHGYKGDKAGNIHLPEPYFADTLLATASQKTIVTVEEVVTEDEMRRLGVAIPYYHVAAIVEVPYGAHPTSCYPAYSYDRKHISQYIRVAQKSDEEFKKEYLDTYVLNTGSHADYLKIVGDAEHFNRLSHWEDDIATWKGMFDL